MAENKQLGKQSIRFAHPPFIRGTASIAGTKEGEGPYGKYFDEIEQDPTAGSGSWEEAEGKLQEKAAGLAIEKAGCKIEDIRYIVAGDLLGQLMASSFGLMKLDRPLFGVYGACSTMGESLAVASIITEGGFANNVLAVTSSHFASAEKQFRFPLGYANQRNKSATWTVTGSGAVVVSASENSQQENGQVFVTGITTGKIVDYGVKDSMNMGACMAPAAADAIVQHFIDFGQTPGQYDKIITGDLGLVGKDILIDIIRAKGYDISDVRCFGKYLESKGFIKHKQPRKANNTKYTGKEFVKKFNGVCVAKIGAHHIVCIKDGKVLDVWNSSNECIGNYWTNQ